MKSVALLKLIISTVLLGALPTAARAEIYYKDDRVAIKRTKALYRPIGVVLNSARTQAGTGFLVDRCHVLTAQHIESVSPNLPISGASIVFYAGHGAHAVNPRIVSTGNFEAPVRGSIIKHGKFDGDIANQSDDWMLIRLNECIGNRHGYVRLSPDDIGKYTSRKVPLKSAGFPLDRDWSVGTWLDPACNAKGYRYSTWLHDCASHPGLSGAPIFYESVADGAPVLAVVAMNVGSLPYEGTPEPTWTRLNSNTAVNIKYIYPHIKDLLDPR